MQNEDFFNRENVYAEYDPETGLFGNPKFYSNQISAKKERKTKMQRVNDFFGLEFFTSLLIAIQLNLILAVMVNIRNFWYIPFIVWVNSTLSVAFLFFYIKFIYTLLERSIKLEKLRQGREDISTKQLESILEFHDLQRWVFLKKELKQRTSFIGGILL